ncbi:RRM domain-containing protein [[Candida] zeylanoides]
MTSSKLSKGASDRLLSLLYSATSVEVANKTPLVTKFIHDHQPQDRPPSSPRKITPTHRSILDDLMENDWNQKPLSQAEVDLPKLASTQIKSNILKFKCKNNYISGDTFLNLYPIKRERKYQLPPDIVNRGPALAAIKGRDPQDLHPLGLYYLIFKDFTQAAAYWLETLGKVTNGFDLHLEFTKLTSEDVSQISSPHLDMLAGIGVQQNNGLGSRVEWARERVSDIKTSDPSSPLVYELEDILALSQYLIRKSTVLVKNLPFGLSKHALPKVLWDYQLRHLDYSHSIRTVVNDPINQLHLKMISFADEQNARRFVRNFHGRKWDSVQTAKEKMLYEPILCEVVE